MMPLEGLSVWPTIFLRLATLLLCIWLLVRGWQRLERNTNKIVQDLHLTATWQNVADERASIIGVGPPWTRLLRYLGYRLPGNGAGQNGNAVHFWRRYIYRARWIARIGRVTIGIAAMAVLWAILTLIFGHPHDPIRGQISLWTYNIVTFALILAILVLIFSVADATLLCWSLIKAFRKKVPAFGRLERCRNSAHDLIYRRPVSMIGSSSSSSPSAPNASPVFSIIRS